LRLGYIKIFKIKILKVGISDKSAKEKLTAYSSKDLPLKCDENETPSDIYYFNYIILIILFYICYT